MVSRPNLGDESIYTLRPVRPVHPRPSCTFYEETTIVHYYMVGALAPTNMRVESYGRGRLVYGAEDLVRRRK